MRTHARGPTLGRTRIEWHTDRQPWVYARLYPLPVLSKLAANDFSFKPLNLLVEPRGFEPLTSAVRLRRSPN
jgi:hypothetical protein